jgi:hypothetical protein
MRIAFAVVAACLVLGGCSHPYQAYQAEPRPDLHLHPHLHRHPPKALKTLSARTSRPLHAGQTNNAVTSSQEGQHRAPTGNSSPSGSSGPTESSSPSGSSGPTESSSPSGSSSPSASANPPATARYYVVLDPVDSCAVIVTKPSSGFNTLGDKSGYTSLAAANKALNAAKAKCKGVIGTEVEAKFQAAKAKAAKLGVDKLTREDIEGLSDEQIKQLRGY